MGEAIIIFGFLRVGFCEPVGGEFAIHFMIAGKNYDLGKADSMDKIEQKMSQFLKGSVFKIDARSQEPTRVQYIYEELRLWAIPHGYGVTIYRE